MKTTTSQATRAVINERAIVAQWRGVASHPIHPPPRSAPSNLPAEYYSVRHFYGFISTLGTGHKVTARVGWAGGNMDGS